MTSASVGMSGSRKQRRRLSVAAAASLIPSGFGWTILQDICGYAWRLLSLGGKTRCVGARRFGIRRSGMDRMLVSDAKR